MEANFQEELEALKELIEGLNAFQKAYLTLDESARYLGISKSCLYKKTSDKVIPHYKPGGKLTYLKKTNLDAWVENGFIPTTNQELSRLDISQLREGGQS